MNQQILLLTLLGLPLCAQDFRSDFNAARVLSQSFQNKVFRDRIEAHWLPDNHRFWYRVRTGAQAHRFMLVNAETGARQPAFDHERLAGALRQAGLAEIHEEDLPLTDLAFEDSALSFQANGQAWRCEVPGYDLTFIEDIALDGGSRDDMPQASFQTGEETSITFRNDTDGETRIYWLDSAGQRVLYARLTAGEEREQHTFAGHVWLATDAQEKTVAWFQAKASPFVAAIRVAENLSRPRSRPRARRGERSGQSPDGAWRASIQDNNVILQSADSDERLALTKDGATENAYLPRFFWSPDSRKLVAIRRHPGEDHQVQLIESSPTDQVQPKLISFSYPKPGDRIDQDWPVLIDVAQRQCLALTNDLFPNPWSITRVEWLSDSSEFLFLYNQRGHQLLRVIAVNAANGATRPVLEEQSKTFIDYAGKLFLRLLPETQELIWMSERDGWNHLYLYDVATGAIKNQITRGSWVVREVDQVDADARQIWFTAGGIFPDQDPYYAQYCRVDFDGSNLTTLTEANGTHNAQFSPDRRFLIDTWSRVDSPPVIELRRTDTGSLVCPLEEADLAGLRQTGWRAPEPFVAKGRDGATDIFGIILRPTHFDESQKYPVLEQIYAGPQSAYVPKAFGAVRRPQELAELGFVVVQIDGMGTSQRSKAFHDVCWKNLGDAGFPDRIAWMRAAAALHPEMDLTRVGIYGGSAGGQNALRAVLAHGDFYKAAAADCGCHDNRMDKIWWNELWMGWPIGPHYEEQSNVTQARRLQGKLLLTVGELDRNVDPSSTMQVVNALIKADKDFEMLIVPGAGHGVGESPYAARRRAEFFVRNLRDGSGPAH